MTFHHNYQPPRGMLPPAGGYKFGAGGGNSNQPWMAGLASFANSIAQNLQGAKNFERQKQIAAIKPQAQLPVLQQKGTDALALERERQKGRVAIQGMKGEQQKENQVFKNPKAAMQVIMSKYNLTGDPVKDAAAHGPQLPIIKNKAENEFAQTAGFKGKEDPTYKQVVADEKFQKAMAFGQPYDFGPGAQSITPAAPAATPETPEESGPGGL